MKIPYLLGLKVYGVLIAFASLFNEKAKKRFEGQRKIFSFLSENIDAKSNEKYVWFHAASLGEFEQGRPMMEKLRKSYPEYKILLTFFSPSGYEVRKNYEGADLVCYLPLDIPSNVKRFLNLVKPEKVIFIKYEFWPNFLLYCKKHNIPTYVVSANFRADQIFFKWYGARYASVLKAFKKIFVQDQDSKTLLESIGVKDVEIAGDTRFDRVIEIAEAKKDLPLVKSFKGENKLIIAGSSWPKDEDLLIQYLADNDNVKMLIAPHEIHESHIADIESKLNFASVRYSKADVESVVNARCLIVDSFGLLSSLYQYADVAYIGGGFGVGIHNTVEAAVYGIPVVFGPNYQKFREARELIAKGGAFSIQEYWQLQSSFDWMLLDGEKAGKISYNYVHDNKGATDKILKQIFS